MVILALREVDGWNFLFPRFILYIKLIILVYKVDRLV